VEEAAVQLPQYFILSSNGKSRKLKKKRVWEEKEKNPPPKPRNA
jgi:hypothetical protein